MTEKPRPPWIAGLLFAGVYGLFAWSFGRKVHDYLLDVWRHFDFVRDWFA